MKRVFFSMTLICTVLWACNNNPEAESETTETKQTEQSEATSEAEEPEAIGDVEVEEIFINVKTVGETMTTMAYEPKQINVAPGALVTLSLENTASSEAMIHNWVLIEVGKQAEVSKAGMAAGQDNSYLPDASMYIAATSMANPGETVEVTFNAPLKKGTYQYICTYPGHTDMKGLFVVK